MADSPSHALILVVEDDALQRIFASGMFLDAGYRVLEAENADEALRLLETNAEIRETNAEIRLLFTDINMPGSMDGSQLACHVTDRWPRVAIIIVSGRPRPDERGLSMRFHDKPYEPTAVLRQARDMTAALA